MVCVFLGHRRRIRLRGPGLWMFQGVRTAVVGGVPAHSLENVSNSPQHRITRNTKEDELRRRAGEEWFLLNPTPHYPGPPGSRHRCQHYRHPQTRGVRVVLFARGLGIIIEFRSTTHKNDMYKRRLRIRLRVEIERCGLAAAAAGDRSCTIRLFRPEGHGRGRGRGAGSGRRDHLIRAIRFSSTKTTHTSHGWSGVKERRRIVGRRWEAVAGDVSLQHAGDSGWVLRRYRVSIQLVRYSAIGWTRGREMGVESLTSAWWRRRENMSRAGCDGQDVPRYSGSARVSIRNVECTAATPAASGDQLLEQQGAERWRRIVVISIELGAKMPQSPPAFIAVAVVQLSKPFSRHTSSHIQVDAPSCRPFKPPPSMPKAAVDAASRPSLRQRSQGWINTPPRPPPPPSTTSSSHSSKTGVMLVTPGSRLSPRIPGSVPPLAALQVPVPAVICGCQTSSPSFECVPSVSTSSRPSFDDSWQTTAVTTRPSAPSPPSRGPSSFDLRLSAVHALVRLLTNSLSSYSLSDCSIFQVV
ncbi:hypothetical protein C8F01DRAFT_1237957 [Mycena amicta]|nr:hypothetical protein C8F01DRAFT_1237957 [Mycena amicta]